MNFCFSGSKQRVPSGGSVTKDGSLYFAYGSNLHLTQMADRCPASVFKGKAVLSGYRWQINERGVANVVKSIDDYVEGLLYLVNPKDERSLDRSEGVAKNFYQKHLLAVAFEPHRQFENRKSSEVAQLISQSVTAKVTTGAKSEGRVDASHGVTFKNLTDQSTDESNPDHDKRQEEQNSIRNVKVLVYVSENYTNNGTIRREYIPRLQKAILDAEILGVSRSFVGKYVTPFLDEKKEVLPAPNHAEGSGHILILRGNDDSTEAKSEPMKVFQKDQGQMSGKPQFQLSEGSNDSLDRVDFQGLECANRDPHTDSGLKFPTDMLDAIMSTHSKVMRDQYEMIYIVVANEDNVDSTPRFDILATSQDLELANELAIKHFRNQCSQSFSDITDETREHWARSNGAGIQSNGFNWKLDKDAYIQLDTTVPGNSHRITVRVNAQKLLARS
ncbi:hypothetical protein F4782DRAFT_533019 [Xylaria castorea]|nr:hypothetical protein F4782DRAFT_533019 [Xylaria castorea]